MSLAANVWQRNRLVSTGISLIIDRCTKLPCPLEWFIVAGNNNLHLDPRILLV